ncbi:MAG: transposase zinc-binding domain-containing protein [Planctomycetes bacterium]|nr:transposase zinc-binding domain-containing protein [Planctomycetota bacterium]
MAPKCHKSDIQAWLQGRQKEILPVPYYHVIFTLPHELRGFMRRLSKFSSPKLVGKPPVPLTRSLR